ncbi:HD-GYP domain-containing protein [Cupriavidus sp. BIC8F]|uniref:HD-GYP domain-containing protein n=1 Tax=Cupriavidus sp. BIC8F TaxID=3079014 RepID=UPI00291654CE|nr:HD domain-containing phosphohydrolase [Cupriavidus sp. BIC8F]
MSYRAVVTLASLAVASCTRYPAAAGHLIRTSCIASCLADLMGLDIREQQRIRIATPVHDLGKMAVPDYVLLKPGKLDQAERRIMERHSSIGADLLAGSSDELLQFASQIARHHHERFDGSGYPDRLAGPDVPLAARIVAVADAFDAMTEVRCYRPRMSDNEAKDPSKNNLNNYVLRRDVRGLMR